MKAKGEKRVPGSVIFKLYDTYGFPVDIVRDVVKDANLSLDMEGFETCMDAQRAQSRTVTSFTKISDAYKSLSAQGIKPEFTGYGTISCESKVLVVVEKGNETQTASTGAEIEVVTAQTPFYGESGGQVGDIGKITGPDLEIVISDTIKDPTGLIIHKGKIVSGEIRKGDRVTLSVDRSERDATACNHTATHILHAALRKVLGDHVRQAGSMVSPERLRFDFTHFSQIETEALEKVESLVNERIRENVQVQTHEMDAEDAFKSGATALFEEKYGDRVRVVSLAAFSKELCGGTHTRYTGNIGVFKIVSESSVASGVRRIEALTGNNALAHIQKTSRIVQEASGMLREKPEGLVSRVEKLLSAQKALEKEIEKIKSKMAAQSAEDSGEDIKTINGVTVIAKKVSADTPAALRDLADKFRDKIKSGIVVLGSVSGGKVLLIAGVTKDLTKRFHAGNIVKAAAEVVGGSGGGRPDMAQAGGTKPEKLDEAIRKACEIIGTV